VSHIERFPPCRGARARGAARMYSKDYKRKPKVFGENRARARAGKRKVFKENSPLIPHARGEVSKLFVKKEAASTSRRGKGDTPAKMQIRVVVSGFSFFFRRSFHLNALSNNLDAYAETFSPIRVWSSAPCSEFCNLLLTSQATELRNYRNTLPFLHQTLTQCSSSSGTIES